jgi:hypothetical protein
MIFSLRSPITLSMASASFGLGDHAGTRPTRSDDDVDQTAGHDDDLSSPACLP